MTSYHASIVQQPTLRVATVSHRGPYRDIAQAFGKLAEYAGGAGLFTADAVLLAVYHDDPDITPPSELRSDAGIIVAADAEIPNGLVERVLPAGRYATLRVNGPYDLLPSAWHHLKTSVTSPDRPHRTQPGYEIYRNNPHDTPPHALITDLYLPVE